MMTKIKKTFLIVLAIALIIAFSACEEDEYPDRVEVFDSNGEYLYTILNQNYFKFDTYNTLEIIVDENEKFILYDKAVDEEETGYGEWIKDGVSFAVYFSNDADRHGDIIISYYDKNPYYSAESEFGYIARVSNDTENTTLRRWVSGYFPYNDKYSTEKIPVETKTYNQNQPYDNIYLPQNALTFYALSEQTNIKYVCDELGLEFDKTTGEGTCTVNGENIPITASFDMETFTFSLRYNTADDRKGVVILSCKGMTINETEATYTVESSSEYSGITVEKITIKIIKN